MVYSISIKRMIYEIIKYENKKKLLNDMGINIAKRTIAKYIEEVGIL